MKNGFSVLVLVLVLVGCRSPKVAITADVRADRLVAAPLGFAATGLDARLAVGVAPEVGAN